MCCWFDQERKSWSIFNSSFASRLSLTSHQSPFFLSFFLNTIKWNKSIAAEFAMFSVRDLETRSTFLSNFNNSKKSITAQIKSSIDSSRLPDISATISDLDKFVVENSYLFPSYEIRSSLKPDLDSCEVKLIGCVNALFLIE
ncbi:hypothetical protein LWI29_022928 [Acer saccharum]|uniref:Tubulin-specific chaperone C N-terminal domain-containing protein n=1 Tax=Acer saccharum TaxID=4024 RepID=A0AA39TGG0_ACESA|nr:hypothetical protein LWI29_022928 [Acer saccharum]